MGWRTAAVIWMGVAALAAFLTTDQDVGNVGGTVAVEFSNGSTWMCERSEND